MDVVVFFLCWSKPAESAPLFILGAVAGGTGFCLGLAPPLAGYVDAVASSELYSPDLSVLGEWEGGVLG